MKNKKIQALLQELCREIENTTDLQEKVDLINKIRTSIHEVSPYKDHPVDCVLWIHKDKVRSNNYNPNKVPHERMKALDKSIQMSGITMPIFSFPDMEEFEIIDGFHRNILISKKSEHLPLTIKDLSIDKRISATMLHNTARGEHIVDLEASLVKKLRNEGKSLVDIAELLQLEGEETLRLNANTTLKDRYANRNYSKSWE